jgi:hypothetical protein
VTWRGLDILGREFRKGKTLTVSLPGASALANHAAKDSRLWDVQSAAMKIGLSVTFALLIVVLAALAQSKAKKTDSGVPGELVNARRVFLTSYTPDGGGYVQRPDAGDLAVISDLRSALREWGYYKEVASPDAADLVIAVRKKTNPLGAQAGTSIDLSTGGVRITQPSSVGGPMEDAISVFGGPHGSNAVVLWKRMKKNGLHPPKMELVGELREFVESGKP